VEAGLRSLYSYLSGRTLNKLKPSSSSSCKIISIISIDEMLTFYRHNLSRCSLWMYIIISSKKIFQISAQYISRKEPCTAMTVEFASRATTIIVPGWGNVLAVETYVTFGCSMPLGSSTYSFSFISSLLLDSNTHCFHRFTWIIYLLL